MLLAHSDQWTCSQINQTRCRLKQISNNIVRRARAAQPGRIAARPARPGRIAAASARCGRALAAAGELGGGRQGHGAGEPLRLPATRASPRGHKRDGGAAWCLGDGSGALLVSCAAGTSAEESSVARNPIACAVPSRALRHRSCLFPPDANFAVSTCIVSRVDAVSPEQRFHQISSLSSLIRLSC